MKPVYSLSLDVSDADLNIMVKNSADSGTECGISLESQVNELFSFWKLVIISINPVSSPLVPNKT
jgi:hypothetical protein